MCAPSDCSAIQHANGTIMFVPKSEVELIRAMVAAVLEEQT